MPKLACEHIARYAQRQLPLRAATVAVAVAVAVALPESEFSNARDSEVRVSLQIGNAEELQPRLDAFLTATAESIQPFPSLHVYNAAQGDTGSEMGLVGTDNHLCHLTTV